MNRSKAISLSPRLQAAIKELLAEDRRLDAVKLVRRNRDLTLLQSLRVVEDFADRLPNRRNVSPTTQHRNRNRFLLLVPLLFLITGILLGSIAYCIHQSHQRLDAEGIRVSGEVIGLHSNGKCAGPIVGYLVDEARYEYRSNVLTSNCGYRVGDSVALLIDPAKPESPLIDDTLHRYSAVVILSVMGGGFSLLGCILFPVAFKVV